MALGVFFEPQYFLAQRILTKVTAISSIIGDIYDAYGTMEELKSLTEAIERLFGFLDMDFIGIISELLVQISCSSKDILCNNYFTFRWDASCTDQLPVDYQKWVYRALLDFYEEIEEEMAKQGNSYPVHCAKEVV